MAAGAAVEIGAWATGNGKNSRCWGGGEMMGVPWNSGVANLELECSMGHLWLALRRSCKTGFGLLGGHKGLAHLENIICT